MRSLSQICSSFLRLMLSQDHIAFTNGATETTGTESISQGYTLDIDLSNQLAGTGAAATVSIQAKDYLLQQSESTAAAAVGTIEGTAPAVTDKAFFSCRRQRQRLCSQVLQQGKSAAAAPADLFRAKHCSVRTMLQAPSPSTAERAHWRFGYALSTLLTTRRRDVPPALRTRVPRWTWRHRRHLL